ncbi:MAG: hypothetical protein PF481_10905 [Bacteroidales bacterium]|jgi:antitoxin component YwqK of YwqJK toxin-antitoxin module|nr:hypothetical protein [Bacteroidales bacterium]
MKYIISLYLIVALACIGNAQDSLVNYKDINQKKQGYWIKKDDNNNKIYEGYFKNDIPVGQFKKYHENGELKYDMYYNPEDLKSVTVTMYDITGELSAKGAYYDKKKNGKWLYYGADELLILEEQYDMGILDGKSIVYWQDKTHNPAEIKNWKKGVKDGAWTWYYSDGSIRMKAGYKNDKLHGDFIVYFVDGSTHIKGKYYEDKRDGIWEYYNEDGENYITISYNKGEITNKEEFEKQQTEYVNSLLEEDSTQKDPGKYIDNPELLLYEEKNIENPETQNSNARNKKEGFFKKLFKSKKNTDKSLK